MAVSLPKLKTLPKKASKYIYKLADSTKTRRKAIDEGINNSKRSKRDAALAKKRRFGVIRIYQRYKNPEYCKKITSDMKYIDKRYLGKSAVTRNIC